MDCDCPSLLNKIDNDQAQLTIWQATKEVAEQNITTWQMNLWYDQYNYMLCGCGGGSGMMLAAAPKDATPCPKREEVAKAILARDDNKDEMAIVATKDGLLRMHKLVMAQITV